MKKLSRVLLLTAVCSVIPTTDMAFASNPWAYENYSPSVGYIYSPLFGTNVNAGVASSWNEPRGSGDGATGPHKGVDQSVAIGSEVGPIAGTARVLYNHDYYSAGGLGQTIRYYNSATGKTFYSQYFHLNEFISLENSTPSLTTITAKSGATGGVSAHLHWEVLDSISGDVGYVDVSTRIGMNPMLQSTTSSTLTTSTIQKFGVFKNEAWSLRTISLDAWDSNGFTDPMTAVKIYFRANGSTTWQSANMSISGSNYHYTYTFDSSITNVEYFIAGRRKVSERWSLYPVSVYDTGESSSGVTPTSAYNVFYKTFR